MLQNAYLYQIYPYHSTSIQPYVHTDILTVTYTCMWYVLKGNRPRFLDNFTCPFISCALRPSPRAIRICSHHGLTTLRPPPIIKVSSSPSGPYSLSPHGLLLSLNLSACTSVKQPACSSRKSWSTIPAFDSHHVLSLDTCFTNA